MKKEELIEFGKLVLDTFHSEGKTNSGKPRLARVKYNEWVNEQLSTTCTDTEEKGNKIIAYFMKVEWTPDLNYHEDWNKLMPVWVALREEHSWGLRAPYLDEWGNIARINGIESAILRSDLREAWNLITGFINKYILTEEEHLKFK